MTVPRYQCEHCLIILLTYELRLETRTSTSSPSLNDYLSICAQSSSRLISENRYLVIQFSERQRHQWVRLSQVAVRCSHRIRRRMSVRDSTRDRGWLFGFISFLLMAGRPRLVTRRPSHATLDGALLAPSYTPWLTTQVMVQEIGLAGHGVRSLSIASGGRVRPRGSAVPPSDMQRLL